MSANEIPNEAEQRARLRQPGRWIVKIGSSLVSRPGVGLDEERIASWSRQIIELRADGHEVALVSSGAVAAGLQRLGLDTRPSDAGKLRALAAIGQPQLVHAYESVFARHDVHTALMLLTHEDFNHRDRYLNMRATLDGLLSLGVVPVLNENDTVTIEEIRFGDNDILAALAADLAAATALVILTDCAGLHDKNPARHGDARLISIAKATDGALDAGAESGGHLGQGGMITKLKAARYAARSGCLTLIADGREEGVLTKLRDGVSLGTMLLPAERLSARKRWISGLRHARGQLRLDAGAAAALAQGGKSLLAVGVVDVSGDFGSGDLVACLGPDGQTVAYGFARMSSVDVQRFKGLGKEQIKSQYSQNVSGVVVHYDDLALEG